MQSHFLLYIVIQCLLYIASTETFFKNFIKKHCIRDHRAHLWEKHAVFAYLFQCISPK